MTDSQDTATEAAATVPGQESAIPGLPEATRPPVGPEWVCSNCGNPGAEPILTRPTLDERFRIGFCNTCSKPNPDRKTPRPTNQLVHVDRFNRARWQHDRDMKELQALIREFARGKDKVRLKGTEAVRLLELYDRYGWTGWAPTGDLRADVDKYLAKERTRISLQKASKSVRDRSGA